MTVPRGDSLTAPSFWWFLLIRTGSDWQGGMDFGEELVRETVMDCCQ